MTTEAQLILDCNNLHGEGIVWEPVSGCVWWSDIEQRQLWCFDPDTQRSKSYTMPHRVCCFAPRAKGGFVIAYDRGIALWDAESKRWQSIITLPDGLPQVRLNDGRTDRQGRLVVGGMDERDLAPVASVYRLEADFSLTTLLGGVSCTNSIAFSPDGTICYFTDSPTGKILAFSYDLKGLSQSRTFATLDTNKGVADGSCVDEEGYLWTAIWQGHRLERRAPDGTLDRAIFLPVEKPTCCTFGGRTLDTLFITTSRWHSTTAEAGAGGLFSVKPGIKGLPDTPFAG